VKNQYEVWVTDNVVLNIAGDEETLRMIMPDGYTAQKVLELLLQSEDCKQG